MTSEATAMSKPVSRGSPLSLPPRPMTIWRSARSLMSTTRGQVMLKGSMSSCVAVVDVVVDEGGQQVVGRADGVDVAGEVEVEVLHRDDLGVAAARRAALDAEDRAQGWLADAGDHLLADVAQGLGQADGGDRLALAQRRRGDGGDVDVLAVGPVLEPLQDVQVDLGLVLAVELELVLEQADALGNLLDGLHLRGLRDVQVARYSQLNNLPQNVIVPGEDSNAPDVQPDTLRECRVTY